MSEPLNVSVRELSPVRVAMMEHQAGGMAGRYQGAIGAKFLEVEGWIRSRGIRADHLRRIGVPFTEGTELIRYWCCIELPEGVMGDDGPVEVRELAGGRYAVLTLEKNAATIGDSIDRFYSEYAPSQGLALDDSRPPMEIYYRDTVEYCAPVV